MVVSSIIALRHFMFFYIILRCEKKCNAEVVTKIKALPKVLMIRLQRLEFDHKSGNQMKLTNGVQIPTTLDFSEFAMIVMNSLFD